MSDSMDGFNAGDRTYPYYDENIHSMVYGHYEDLMVSVTPMLFNDRVCVTRAEEYPTAYTAGWCYDKGGAAGLAAMAWNPLETDEPVGFKKRVGEQP